MEAKEAKEEDADKPEANEQKYRTQPEANLHRLDSRNQRVQFGKKSMLGLDESGSRDQLAATTTKIAKSSSLHKKNLSSSTTK